MPEKFYVTTPIYYVNARPHIGHAYTTIVADVLARRHRLLGEDVFFLTGTDEHGQKIERSAAAAGIPPQQFADQVSKSFETLWQRMGITNDQYIRTTDPAHIQGVQKLFTDLHAAGQIYLSSYTGQYSIGEEMFVEGPPGTIGPDGKPTETVTEENFFFRLSDYQLPLLDLIESDTLKITPESRKNEVLSFLRGNLNATETLSTETPEAHPTDAVIPAEGRNLRFSSEAPQPSRAPFIPESHPGMSGATTARTAAGNPYLPGALKDLSISRSSFTWGIPVPQPAASEAKEKHVIYVWLDALANYMTAVGYGSDTPANEANFKKYWPADLHLVGKEIIRFHCVYWPAFLLALNPKLKRTPDGQIPTLTLQEHKEWAAKWLPKAVTAHGWLLFDDAKMSKSKGNIVRTETILEAFGTLCPPAPGLPISPSQTSGAPSQTSGDPSQTSGDPSEPASPLEVGSVLPTFTPEPTLAPNGIRGGLQPPVPGNKTEGALAPGTPLPTNAAHRAPATEAALKGRDFSPAVNVPGKQGALAPEGISPHDRDLFAADILRYFLLREIPFGQDGSFSFEAMITRYNADLANGYGNLVSRTLNLIQQNFAGIVPQGKIDEHGEPLKTGTLQDHAAILLSVIQDDFHHFRFSRVISGAQAAVTLIDTYFSELTPWKLAKSSLPEDRLRLQAVLYSAAEAIRLITALFYPILPYSTAAVWRQLGLGSIEQAAQSGRLRNPTWGGLKAGTRLGPLGPIFPRADSTPAKGLARHMSDMELSKSANTPEGANDAADTTTRTTTEFKEMPLASELDRAPFLPELHPGMSGSTTAPKPAHGTPAPESFPPFDPAAGPRTTTLAEPNPGTTVAGSAAITTERPGTPPHHEAQASGIFASDQSPQITIDDFAKIELRVARILVCERIPKADKLLRLEVDLGYEQRQILSGIAEWYTPEDLIGRRIVVITNLAPRKMRGLESHGMLLAASTEGGKPHLATCGDDDALPLGSRLK